MEGADTEGSSTPTVSAGVVMSLWTHGRRVSPSAREVESGLRAVMSVQFLEPGHSTDISSDVATERVNGLREDGGGVVRQGSEWID